MKKRIEHIVFGGGCFWCTEAIFAELKGVLRVTPGYAGGKALHPTYKQVSSGKSGHAEVVKIEYDPTHISLNDLLSVFFSVHDPTTLNRQGDDIGEQYRSIIFYSSQDQKQLAKVFIEKLSSQKIFNQPIVTTIEPLTVFYEAEEYHKRYYENNVHKPYCRLVIEPKLSELKNKFAKLLKQQN